jgi:hypothetical protein
MAVYARGADQLRAEAERLETGADRVAAARDVGDIVELKAAWRDYRQTVLDLGAEGLIRREAMRASSYLIWAVDRCLHVHMPDRLVAQEARDVARAFAEIYLDVHRGLVGRSGVDFDGAIKALFHDTRLSFAGLARSLPHVIDA